MAIDMNSYHYASGDSCAFVVAGPAEAATLREKYTEYLGRVRSLSPSTFESIPAQPDNPSFRNVLKLAGAELILDHHDRSPGRPITRRIMANAFRERIEADYEPFVSQTPEWCRFTGRQMLDTPLMRGLGSTAAASAGEAFLVLRDYATGFDPQADLSLLYAMIEEGLIGPGDPLYQAPAGPHPAVTAGLPVAARLSA